MIVCSTLDTTRWLLPVYNPSPQARAAAWNAWISDGGAAPVLKFIRWSNGTSTDDDEILQDTIITAYQKVERGEYEHRDVPFTAFLKKIAWYKILEASRRYREQVSLDDVAEVIEDQDHDDYTEFWKEREVLHHALAQLPARRSQVILLYEDGYTTSEIAAKLRIREDLVRKEKSLGLRELKAKVAVAIAG